MKLAKIIFEDEEILVVNKKAQVVVNKSQTFQEETLQDELGEYFGLESGDLGIGERAGIVHRLDRETSGLLIIAKTQKAFEKLQQQFKNREVQKEYVALAHGKFKDSGGAIKSNIARVGKFGKFGVNKDGRESETEYRVEQSYKLNTQVSSSFLTQNFTKSRINYLKNHAVDYTLVRLFPKTGRTHQIRVHLKSLGHPIVSDLIYGPSKLLKFDLTWCPRLFLHAEKITFVHPENDQKISLESDLPDDLKNALQWLVIN